jgi:hypothetical protein
LTTEEDNLPKTVSRLPRQIQEEKSEIDCEGKITFIKLRLSTSRTSIVKGTQVFNWPINWLGMHMW